MITLQFTSILFKNSTIYMSMYKKLTILGFIRIDRYVSTNLMVGLAGFEPATFRPPDGCATKLRYNPIYTEYLFKIFLAFKIKSEVSFIFFTTASLFIFN